MRPWGSKRLPLAVILGVLGSLLGGPRDAFGSHFGSLGVPLGAFGAQSAPKTASLFHGSPFLDSVGAQKGTQEASIIDLKFKSIKKTIEKMLGLFWVRFWWTFVVFW